MRYGVIAVCLVNTVYQRDFFLKFAPQLWYLLLFPIWITISILWTPVFGTAFKFAIMHCLDIFMIAYIALRLSPEQIAKFLFWGYVPIGLLIFSEFSLLQRTYESEAFSEKNMVGNRLFFLIVSSWFVTFDKKSHLLEKLLAAALILPSFIAIYKVESATSFATALAASLAFVMFALFWKTIKKIQSGRVVVALIGLALTLLATLFFVSISKGPAEFLLSALEKDTTLTGRTELWAYARDLFDRNPIHGVGAEGFWQTGRGQAEMILEEFDKDEYIRFSFHNSYWEIMVHLGIVGLVFMLIPLVFILQRTIRLWFKHQNMTATFFVLMCSLPMARSMTESDLYNVFDPNKFMLFLAGLYGLSYKTGIIRSGDTKIIHKEKEYDLNLKDPAR